MDNQTQREVEGVQDKETMDPKRNFKEVDIGAFNRQYPQERFPSKDDSPPEMPVTARWRLNLCALSQRFNLYFVVCGDEIHITIPRNVKQKLPGRSDARIPIPQTVRGSMIRGHLDQEYPHYANHLICGNLGNEEIILLSCDDGDVVAFYTFAIYNQVKAFDTTPSTSPVLDIKPLFHCNVGVSAWGLAIHQKSRLIAVSTNNHEAHLFGFAIKGKAPPNGEEVDSEKRLSSELFEDLQISPSSADDQRYNCYRFVYRMGRGASNIPSIAFVSNEHGDAELLLASDIFGHLWQVKLWGARRQDRAELLSGSDAFDGEWGWCVLVLPIDSFKCEQTPLKAFGIDDMVNSVAFLGRYQRPYVSITESALDIIDQTTRIRLNIPGMFQVENLPADDSDDEYDSGSDKDETSIPRPTSRPSPSSQPSVHPALRHCIDLNLPENEMIIPTQPSSSLSPTKAEEKEKKQKEDIIAYRNDIFRHLVNTLPSEVADYAAFKKVVTRAKLRWLHPSPETDTQLNSPDHTPEGLEASKPRLPDGCAILRTYNRAIELITPVPGIPNTIFTDVLEDRLRRRPAHLEASHRMNMFVSIPELSLVIVASQAGEAVVLSLTKMERGYSKFGEVCMFRVEYYLPFSRHLVAPGERRPLLGIAASRVVVRGGFEGVAGLGDGGSGERWRVFLAFRDHGVVSYEVWRGAYNTVLLI